MADRNERGFGIVLELQGNKELIRAMEQLSNKVQRDIGRKAVRAGSMPIFKEAKANLGRVVSDEATGKLKKSMGRRFRTKKGIHYVVIGPALPEGAHAHLVEFGTGPRYRHSLESRAVAGEKAAGLGRTTQKEARVIKGKLEAAGIHGGYTGIMPARAFMRPAYDSQRGKAIEEMEKKLQEEIFKGR